ncbi:hypothetical protein [Olleya marilimosa]|uniref:hypothetical protein n=1 Tax=Olleya marilimosa TaxID=272164 RepID=UPI0030ED1C7F|tara:strand:- start:111566 stop:112111 length:546 start_codon:yes stop_codon:yes gene_type:complete
MKNIFFVLTLFLVSAITVSAQEWIDYKSEELAFIAKYPVQPVQTLEVIDTEAGPLDMYMVMHVATSESSNNVVYSVIKSTYPESQFEEVSEGYNDEVLDSAVQGAVGNVNGTLIFENKVTHNGYPGRSIKIEIDKAFIYMNAFLVDNMMFISQVICMTDKDENADIKRFMDSFDIIKVKED